MSLTTKASWCDRDSVGGYLLPLKDAVRKPQQLTVGDEVTVQMTIRLRE